MRVATPRPWKSSVGGREGHLGGAGLAQAVVAGHGDDAIAVAGEQRHPCVTVGLGVRRRDGVGAPEAVEAQVAALGAQAVEERLDVVVVLGRRRAQPQRRAVAQDDVADDRLRRRRHGHMRCQ